MRLWKSRNGSRLTWWRRPGQEVKDLITAYGNIERRDTSVVATLDSKKLPSHLQGSDAVKEARRWMMVIASRGRLVLRFKESNTDHSDVPRDRAEVTDVKDVKSA